MNVTRRTFVQIGTVGAAGSLASCGAEPAPAPAPAPRVQQTTLGLTVNIGGGFGMVFTKDGKFACGSMRLPLASGCPAMDHVATLRLIRGTMTKDSSGLPRADGPAGLYQYKWTVKGATLSLVDGGGTGPVQKPMFTTLSPGGGEDLPTPTNGNWDDWHYTFTPTRHHKDATLDPNWRAKMDGIIELTGVELELMNPSQDCAAKGRFGAERIKQTDAAYAKPITDAIDAVADSTASVVRLVVASGKEIVIEPANGQVFLALKMESPMRSPAFSYKAGAKLEHVAMYYDLLTPAIPCAERLIPAYLGYPAGQDCVQAPSEEESDPGGYCPGASFVEP